MRFHQIRQLTCGCASRSDRIPLLHRLAEIPIDETAAAWLAFCTERSGEVTRFKGDKFFDVRTAMFEAAGVQSKQNGFRHSFASYHLAKFKDAKETARILGHVDPNVIHYKQLVSAKDAERFSSLRPKVAPNIVSIGELYDLVKDPYQLHNVYGQPEYEAIRRDLMKRMERCMRELDDPVHGWFQRLAAVY